MSERYLIWSVDHQEWWRQSRFGYTGDIVEAGKFSRKDAETICAGANIVGMKEVMLLCPEEIP